MVYIILVNYNGLQDTISCIQSIKESTFKEFKIIVVDNGSNDESLKYLRAMEDSVVTILDAGGNLGFSGGNNIGIQYALENNAEYILLLNNDTVIHRDCLKELVMTAQEFDDQAIIGITERLDFNRFRRGGHDTHT